MKAADELCPGSALESIRGKEDEQHGEEQNQREREQAKA
jgi:hypothetical protein